MELVLMVKRFGALKLKVVERTVWAWVLTIR